MTPVARLATVALGENGAQALRKLSNAGTGELAVVEQGELRGRPGGGKPGTTP